jgi:hypothetical protein
MAHVEYAAGRFPADCEGLREQIVQELPSVEPLAKFLGLVGEGVVREGSQT